MHKISRLFAVLVATAALLSGPVALAQATKDTPAPDAKATPAPDTKSKPASEAKSKAAPAKGDAVAKGKDLYPQSYFDFMVKQRTTAGQQAQPDTPELRASVHDELNTRELLLREAKKQGTDKNPAIKAESELASQTVIVRAYMADYLKSHPVPDDMMHKEYDTIKAAIGDKEYKVRHILVEKEDEAKDIIAALQKGEKFEKLAAERSKDTGSKANGGDLDWNGPASFVKPFSDAMVALQKGKFTTTPVQTQFGWHVIQLDDTRDAKVPPFEEVKPQLTQRLQGQVVDKYVRDLRAKNGL